MTTWLVTGAGGALGRDLMAVLTAAGSDSATGLDRHALDITDRSAVEEALTAHRPDVVINAAAYTRVDDAETDERTAAAVNGAGPGHLARWCAANRARLVHVSTDYVFTGEASSPYETDSPTGPASAYGRTKLAGEQAVLDAGGDGHVVRTGWLYGEHGPSFVRSVGGRLIAGDPVDVVDDQRGAPTWTRHLAERLVSLGGAPVPPGVRHCSSAGEASWYDVAVQLAVLLGRDPAQVRPTTSAAMARPAPRPAYSVLSSASWTSAGLPAMPDWRDSLSEAVSALGERLVGPLPGAARR
ncbi:MAG TPA: dTDP-4-dehydrorhamnose reductase [Mycobacteriales bacterium]|nr:dTDP-4-dehydrorhamnose reductase [Mycobacteriales bacterium]